MFGKYLKFLKGREIDRDVSNAVAVDSYGRVTKEEHIYRLNNREKPAPDLLAPTSEMIEEPLSENPDNVSPAAESMFDYLDIEELEERLETVTGDDLAVSTSKQRSSLESRALSIKKAKDELKKRK